MKRLIALLPLTLALLATVPAFAQEDPPDDDKQEVVESRMKLIRARVLRQEVGLSEEKAKKVEAILDKYQPQRRALRQKLKGHRTTLAGLLQQDSNDDAAYAREIKGLRDTHRKLQELRDQEIDELMKVMTPKEQAKFAAAMERMRNRVQQSVRQHQGRGAPPPR